jgi:hypothetical protein
MSIKHTLLAASLALSSFGVFASGDINPHGFTWDTGPSQVSREQVRDELRAAQRAGRGFSSEIGPSPSEWAAPSMRSRAEVLAEVREAQRLGLGVGSESRPTIATPSQERQIARAASEVRMLMAAAR